ncbi:MAG TPA: protein translocase subunit SecD [Candidatus Paceibacterota bacterium]
MANSRFTAVFLLALAFFGGFFVYSSEKGTESALGNFPFKYGLDLNGGTHLVYQADTSKVASGEVNGAMNALRDTIENRINVFGVSEPLVQVEEANIGGQTVEKLIVELPGVTDTEKAIDIIGQTPILEFKLLRPAATSTVVASSTITATADELFEDTGLTGRFLSRADLEFDPNTGAPSVLLTFNNEGKDLFAVITKENIGRMLAIFLDGRPLSTPVIREEIPDGKAQITGTFTPDEAKKLVQSLNYGALPLPISLLGSQTIGASLGEGALSASVYAGVLSFIIISIFLILWYRLPGVVAVFALAIYTVLNLAIFKLVPVTLTSAGLAAFILSIGMAVDANILIFERMKEELRRGLPLNDAIKEGFHRAWLSIRDSNLSSIITAIILYYFATSALIKGFAFVFFIGVVTSMFTAITVSRTLLIALGVKGENKFIKFIFGNGIGNK